MRVTNDIKAKIKQEVKLHSQQYLNEFTVQIESEYQRVKSWRKARLEILKNEIEPPVKAWAKKCKKDYSQYRWGSVSAELSSAALTEKLLEGFFKDSWRSEIPDVFTEKYYKLKEQQEKFKAKLEVLLFDAYIKVSSIKSLNELKDLINQTKIEVTALYENRENL